MSKEIPISRPRQDEAHHIGARELVLENAANELIFAVVGHVGSGNSAIAEVLQVLLRNVDTQSIPFDAHILKARAGIVEWAESNNAPIPEGNPKDLDYVERLQDLGDQFRFSTRDYAAVARSFVREIRAQRAKSIGRDASPSEPVLPDGAPRAYILDSIRHPAEVQLLRHVYQDAFVLIGVVCEESARLDRLTRKYDNAGVANARRFMERDARADDDFGQRVSDAFHLADFFIDNTAPRFDNGGSANPDWNVNEELSRLVKLVSHTDVVRPRMSETAMHFAYGAQSRSACLSRQVGAALVDPSGNLLAVGTNEVPKAGGGVYGERFDDEHEDHRCAFHSTLGFCSNTREQKRIIDELIERIDELKKLEPKRKEEIRKTLRGSPVGDLLEFSRAVHAEMDALLSASRSGVSTVGARLFVTTFPCHYCARHIGMRSTNPVFRRLVELMHGDLLAT